MGVLKCFSGLKMGAYILHRLSSKFFTSVNSSVQKVCFCFGYFSCKLDSLMVIVSLFNELCDLFSCCVPEGEDVVNKSFPDERL